MALELTALVYVAPALAYSLVAGARGVRLPDDGTGWGALAAVVLLGALVPSWLMFAGLLRVGAGTGSLLSTVEALVGVALAFAVLGESLSPSQLVGGLLLLAAVAALAVVARRPAEPLPPHA